MYLIGGHCFFNVLKFVQYIFFKYIYICIQYEFVINFTYQLRILILDIILHIKITLLFNLVISLVYNIYIIYIREITKLNSNVILMCKIISNISIRN